MGPENLSDYEIKRLENIRRNNEMMASFKISSIVADISHDSKRRRDEAKSKNLIQKKKPKADTNTIEVRRSLRTRGMPPSLNALQFGEDKCETKTLKYPTLSPKKLGPLSMSEASTAINSDRSLARQIVRIAKELVGIEEGSETLKEESREAKHWKVEKEKVEVEDLLFCSNRVYKEEREEGTETRDSLDILSLSLNPNNIARVLSSSITNLRFFPCANYRMIVAGNKKGDIGLWNLDREIDEEEHEDGARGLDRYHPHGGPVSGISIQPQCLSKVFSTCYDGLIRLLDVEKEVFDLIYSGEEPIFSSAQRSTDTKGLYFGEGYGGLNIWDERSGKCSTRRSLHGNRINSVDFNSANDNHMATSSTDGTACIWDLRSIDENKPRSLKTVSHEKSVHSAYFSPSGKCLATSSFDDTVCITYGANFEKKSQIKHHNQTGRWIPPFKAIWGWTDSQIFIGNMKRGVDIISPDQKKTIFKLESPYISANPCRFDAHPYHIGTLATGTAGGEVYVWTLS